MTSKISFRCLIPSI